MLESFGTENFEPLLRGGYYTVILVAASGALGLVVGLLFGLGRTAHTAPIRWLSLAYISFIRGQPVLIILFFAYYVIPLVFPAATFSRLTTAIVGLTVYAGAYLAEILRGSINSVAVGQTEAASALGMNYFLRLRYVVLPQAMKVAVPPTVGFIVALVKATSLTSVIGFVELTRAGRIVSTVNGEPLTTFLIVALGYIIICYPITLFGKWYERKLV